MRKLPVKVSPEDKQAAVEDILARALDPVIGRLSPPLATAVVTEWAARLSVTEASVRSWIPDDKKATLEEYLAYARKVHRDARIVGKPETYSAPIKSRRAYSAPPIDAQTGELNDYDTPPPEQVNGKLSAHAPDALTELKYEALTTAIQAIKAIPHLYKDVVTLRREMALTGEVLNQVREEVKDMLDLLGEEAKRRLQETALWIETMEKHHNLVPISRIAEVEEENRMALEENRQLHARLERVRRASQGEEG